MPPELLEYLVPFVAITTSGVGLLIGMKMFLNYRRDVRVAQINAEATKSKPEDITLLREEVCFLRDGIDEVNDRLEFHERLLTKAVEEPVSTPV